MSFQIDRASNDGAVETSAHNSDLSASLWSKDEPAREGVQLAAFVDHPKEGYYVDNGVRADYDRRTGIPYRIENGNGSCTFSYPGGGGEYFAPCKPRHHRK